MIVLGWSRSFQFEHCTGMIQVRNGHLVHVQDVIKVPALDFNLHHGNEILLSSLCLGEVLMCSMCGCALSPIDFVNWQIATAFAGTVLFLKARRRRAASRPTILFVS